MLYNEKYFKIEFNRHGSLFHGRVKLEVFVEADKTFFMKSMQ